MASTYLDILWIDDSDDGEGKECVIRTHIMSAFFFSLSWAHPLYFWPFYWVSCRDAKMISMAMSAAGAVPGPSAGVPRLSLSKESPFLPSLLRSTDL